MPSVARLAAKQFSVVSLAQLLEIGLTYRQVRGLVDLGYLHRIHRGVFAVGHRNIPQWGYLQAAFLAGGPESFISHRSSGGGLGVRGIYTRRIELTIPGSGGRKAGLIVHGTRRPPHPEEITLRNGIRLSSFPRMLIEVSPTASAKELDNLITIAARKNLLDLAAMERALDRHARRPGIAKVKDAFAAYRPRPDRKSAFEREFDEELEKHPDIPEPQRNVILLGRFEADCYWPEHKLVVELDGRPYHIAVREIEKDKLKDGKLLVRLQIRTLRITSTRWQFDREDAMADVRELLWLPRELRGAA